MPTADAGPVVTPPAICAPPVMPADVSHPTTVVGSGTPASCTEAALDAAIAAGGVITFDCGAAPATISVTTEKIVTADTVIDGGGLVTLDGGDAVRILGIHATFDKANPTLTVQRVGFAHGHASGTMAPLGTDTDGGGGAIYHLGGTVVAIDAWFTDNRAAELGPDVGGGAIYGVGVGATTVVGCVLSGNRGSNGGAIGVLFNELTIVNSTITGNTATGYGANYIDGMGQQAGHGGNGGGVAMDGENRTLTICGATVSGNHAGAIGGGVFRTSYHGEPTDIDRSTFDGNVVVDHVDEADQSSLAGGLYLQGTAVTMTASTISGNRAHGVAGLWSGGMGPGAPGTVALTNVTIANNSVYVEPDFTKSGLAGALWVDQNAGGTLTNVTIAGNVSQFGAIVGAGGLTIVNSIISNSELNPYVPINCSNLGGGSSAMGDHVLQWPATNMGGADFPCIASPTFADPMLGPLQDNGGPTNTMAPLAGSPAIGAGAGCPQTDQRGHTRTSCTIGAYGD